MDELEKLNQLTASHGELRRGKGLISGVIALSLAILCFLGVLAFHFPEYLTTPQLRRNYDVETMRQLLYWSMVIAGIDPDPAKAAALKSWGRAYWEAVHPHNLGGAYVNFMDADEAKGRVRASYGANWERLVAVKPAYDPKNLFRVNHNIDPAG